MTTSYRVSTHGDHRPSFRCRHASVSSSSLNVKMWKPPTFSSGPPRRGCEALDQPVGAEAARAEEARDEVVVLAQVAERLADPDLRRDAHQLRPRHDAGDADEDRQLRAPRPDVVHPRDRDPRVEADLARDVGRVAGLLEHRRDRRPVVDEGVALGIAGDPDLLERVPDLVHRVERGGRALELPRRSVGIARDDEDVGDAHLRELRDQLGEVRPVAGRAGRRGAAPRDSRARRGACDSSSVGSSPFTGEAVTVIVTSWGTCSSTFSSTPASGITS